MQCTIIIYDLYFWVHDVSQIIKEFGTKLTNNLAHIYRSGIGHQRPNHARDLKSGIIRAPIGKACIFIEGNVFIPFECVTHSGVYNLIFNLS